MDRGLNNFNDAGPLPDSIHIGIVVYGKEYTELLCEITLANLAAMVMEIPPELRKSSLVKIITTIDDKKFIESSSSFCLLKDRIFVEIVDRVRGGDERRDGGYAPMVATQRELVINAANSNAAIIFVGPDTIYSSGSFAYMISKIQKGYRLIVGPGLRVKKNAARSALREILKDSVDGSFALSPHDQIKLFFDKWHPSMDAFIIESNKTVWWKAYVFHRPQKEYLLVRYFQGPTFLAWPKRAAVGFDGFIDHATPEICCDTWREILVVPDAHDCFQLDLTEDNRGAGLRLSDFPKVDLLKSFFQVNEIRNLKLHYGLRTTKIALSRENPSDEVLWQKKFDDTIDPLILLALIYRFKIISKGKLLAAAYRILCIAGTNTWSFLLRKLSRRILLKYKSYDPLERKIS